MLSEATREKNGCMEAVALALQYCGAVVVGFVVSAVIMFAGSAFTVGVVPFLSGSDAGRQGICFAIAYTSALAGVLSGSFCLVGRDRRLASVALLVLGLGYYLARNNLLTAELPPVFAQGATRHPLLLTLALGGLSAVIVTVFMSRRGRNANNALQRTPGSAVSSDSDVSGPAPLS
jgi:hypothetical protein